MDDRIMTSSGWVCEKCGNHWGEPHQGGCYRCKEIAEEEAAATAILRDQFAMAALTGLIARGELAHNVAVALREGKRADIDKNISTAYAYADAMLEMRNK
jgi:hypothetical protein